MITQHSAAAPAPAPFIKRLSRRAGFTLVELLVVIGIIALLIGILLPTLSQARKSARSVVCLSNQRQVATAFALWVADHQGESLPSRTGGLQQFADLDEGGYLDLTQKADIQTCPEAASPPEFPGFSVSFGRSQHGTATTPWVLNKLAIPVEQMTREQRLLNYSLGSYAWNAWVCYKPASDLANATRPQYAEFFLNRGATPRGDLFFGNLGKVSSADTPLIGDGVWGEAGPLEYTLPAADAQNPWPQGSGLGVNPSGAPIPANGNINRYYLARHNDGINLAFTDGSARNLKNLIELWEFKWHADWRLELLPDEVKQELGFPTGSGD